MGRFTDLTGQRFGRWTVIEQHDKKGTHVCWLCRCDCGTERILTSSQIKRSNSCGCYRADRASEVHLKNLVGQKFGRLTVIKRGKMWRTPQGLSQVKWICQCDCGNVVEVFAGNLKKSNTMSCGCYNSEKISEREFIDLTGQRFGLLTAVSRADNYVSKAGNMASRWNCICDCGNTAIVNSNSLRRGLTKSCGCVKRSMGEHNIEEFFKEASVEYVREYSFPDLLSRKGFPLRFDFAIFKNGLLYCLIEFQGKQHYEEFAYSTTVDFGKEQRKYSDPKKREYCKTHNMLLFEIRYDEDLYDSLTNILLDMFDIE